MRSSSNSTKNPMLKKKLSNNAISIQTVDQQAQMNKTSLSSISNTSQKNEDKLQQLKQKLEKERENMRKTGKRFKEGGSSLSQIQIQTEQMDDVKPITTKMLYKSSKVSTGVGSAASGLYDFGSIKAQVENKTKGVFMKRNSSTKQQVMVPVYTPQQIINSVNGPSHVGVGNISKQKLAAQKPQTKPVQLKRQTVNLMELSQVIEKQKSPVKNQSTSKQKLRLATSQSSQQIKFFDLSKVRKSQPSNNQQILQNSRVFESAIKQQKKRNKQVELFLAQVGLQEFAESFINLGFDEVQTLIEVQVDDLNQMMMRAKQQDKLMKFIKEFKKKHQIQDTHQEKTPLVDRPSVIKSRLGYRPKSAALTTQPSQTNQTAQNSRLRSTTQNFNMSESTLISKSSIFYQMGGNEWSLESQVRKACSGCFKVSYEAVKRGECYYCEECDPGEMDQFDISLDESMVREYH